MRNVLAILVVAAVSVSAFADTVKCAVMTSNKLESKAAVKSKKFVDYKGKRYYFCCGDCATAFKKDPAKYAKNGYKIAKAKKNKKA